MRNKSIIIFDGPPASGKTTRSETLALKLCCPIIQYKALGLANIISIILLRLALTPSKININHIGRRKHIMARKDPILIIEEQVLKKIHNMIFLAELLYKTLQILKLMVLFLSHRYLIIDEFITLRAANYINVYLYGGLKKWQVTLLIRLDVSLLRMLSRIGDLHYIYINQHIDELKKLWYKRSHSEDYPSKKYLALIQIVWRRNKEIIHKFAKINELHK